MPLKKQSRLLDVEIKEIKFKIDKDEGLNVPPSTPTNALDMLDVWFKESSEAYFENLMDYKLIFCATLDWDLFMKAKFDCSHVFERITSRELFDPRIKDPKI